MNNHLRLAAFAAMIRALDAPTICPDPHDFKVSKRDITLGPSQRYPAKSCAHQSKGSYCRKGEKYCKAKHAPCKYFELRGK